MQAAGVEVLFLGGYHREAGLIFRHAHDRGYDLQLIANSAMTLEDFPMIAGPELEGTVMAAMTDTRERPEAADVVAQFHAQGYEPQGTTRSTGCRCDLEVWAQAVEAACSLDLNAVTDILRGRHFNTVLGEIGFDAKGDITGFEPWGWFVGKPMAPTCRWSKAWPSNSERNRPTASSFSRCAVERELRIICRG